MLPTLTGLPGVTLVLVGGRIFTQSSNPVLRGVTLEVAGGSPLDYTNKMIAVVVTELQLFFSMSRFLYPFWGFKPALASSRSDNYCTTAMESLPHAVDNTYKLCCPIKSKTLSNKDLKKTWICRQIISNIKNIYYFAIYCQNKIPKNFYTYFRILSPGKLDDQRRIIININSMLQKPI